MSIAGLEEAALVLDAPFAAGEAPDRARVIVGALALDTLAAWDGADRDLRDAAAGLQTLACGGSLDLDEAGRRRARQLAMGARAMTKLEEQRPQTSRRDDVATSNALDAL
jgi:hypothetical protein